MRCAPSCVRQRSGITAWKQNCAGCNAQQPRPPRVRIWVVSCLRSSCAQPAVCVCSPAHLYCLHECLDIVRNMDTPPSCTRLFPDDDLLDIEAGSRQGRHSLVSQLQRAGYGCFLCPRANPPLPLVGFNRCFYSTFCPLYAALFSPHCCSHISY